MKRLAALEGAGQAAPAELAAEVVRWVAGAAGSILAGTPPAEALGLAGRRGAWQNLPVHRARIAARDQALLGLWRLAEGTDAARDRQVQAWVDSWRTLNDCPLTGPVARRLLDTIPEAAWRPLDAIAEAGLPVPAKLRGDRVTRSASPDTPDPQSSVSVEIEAPPVAANG